MIRIFPFLPLLILSIVIALSLATIHHIPHSEFVDLVNRAQDEWVADATFAADRTYADMKHLWMDSAFFDAEVAAADQSIELLGAVEALPAEQLGDSLDWRELEPHCLDYVLNQGQCGSCWAFGSSTALSDRFCIKTGKKSLLSPQDLVACDFAGQLGCHGGYPKRAYEYLEFFGSPSLACFPYTSGVTKVAGHCHHYCADGTAHPHRYYAQKFKSRSYKGVDAIKTALQDGPVTGVMHVYADFPHYKSGIYHHAAGKKLGGHAVAIVGYGVDRESSTPFWIVRNSWGKEWGESGYFRIRMGFNECGIESAASAGFPAV